MAAHPLVAGTLARISYRAAINAAKQQGEALMVAFDLHRFDLLAQLPTRCRRTAHGVRGQPGACGAIGSHCANDCQDSAEDLHLVVCFDRLVGWISSQRATDERLLAPVRQGRPCRWALRLHSVLAFPGLYPQMADRLATAWDDRTDQLDTAAHLCVTFLLATLLSARVLVLTAGMDSGSLSLWAPGALLISYRATIAAAKLQGEMMMAVFELHRFDLLSQLR